MVQREEFLFFIADTDLACYRLDSLARREAVTMIQTWQLQAAKNKFSRVIENAVNGDPQIITRHGIEVAIVLSYAEYQQMTASRGSLSAFFRDSPLAGADVDLGRGKSILRKDVEL